MMNNSAALLTSVLVNVSIEINRNVLHLLTCGMYKFKKTGDHSYDLTSVQEYKYNSLGKV